MKRNLLKLVAGFGTLFALISASSASIVLFHQPKEPKCLKK